VSVQCKASIGGGTTCEGSSKIEFTKAFDTKDGSVCMCVKDRGRGGERDRESVCVCVCR